MKSRSAIVALTILIAAIRYVALAQSPPTVQFKAASVKPTISLAEYVHQSQALRAARAARSNRALGEALQKISAGLTLQISGQRVYTEGMSVKALIAKAYRIDVRLIAGPDWFDDGEMRFAIEAVMPEGSAKEDVPDMLKALLEKRFHLVAHRTSVEQTAYSLVVGKNGDSKLKAAGNVDRSLCAPWEEDGPSWDEDAGGPAVTVNYQICRNPELNVTYRTNSSGGELHSAADGKTHDEYFRMSMPALARLLTHSLSSRGDHETGSLVPVADRTGMDGDWDVVLDTDHGDFGTELSSVSASLEKQGLRLERTTVPVVKLIIDRVEMTPTED